MKKTIVVALIGCFLIFLSSILEIDINRKKSLIKEKKSEILEEKNYHLYIEKDDEINEDTISKNYKKLETVTTVTVTVYNPVKEQTDSSPLETADGSRINLSKLERDKIRWVAVSRDLLKNNKLSYGDKIILKSSNLPEELNDLVWEVRDTMNPKWKNRIDLLSLNRKLGKWEDVKILKIKEDL